MLVGITQRTVIDGSHGEERDALALDWHKEWPSLVPDSALVPIPNIGAAVVSWSDRIAFDALVLSGGNDVGSCPRREETERALLERYVGTMPILGVCRGMQMINDYYGGGLEQELSLETGEEHVATQHEVSLAASPIGSFLGVDHLTVNSYHDQGITDRLAPDLRAWARTDRCVEGLYHPAHPVLGLQWHPERNTPQTQHDADLVRGFLRGDLTW